MRGKGLLIFLLGAASGATAMYYYLREKFRIESEEEIAKIEDNYKDKLEEFEKLHKVEDPPKGEKLFDANVDLNQYRDVVMKTNYTQFSEEDKAANEARINTIEEPRSSAQPYTITPEQFAERNMFDKITLNYYEGDNVLTDDADQPFDPNGILPNDYLDHFDEYERDVVYVRNERISSDFEIVKDKRTYKEVVGILW